MIHLIAPLAQPIGFLWLLLVIIALWLAKKKLRRPAVALGCIALMVNLVGSDVLPRPLLSSLEKPYAHGALTNFAAADAVVMLGGTHRPSPNDAFGLDLTAASDRIVTALELMRLGKGQTLVLGGNGYLDHDVIKPEAALLRGWLDTWKIPNAPVLDLGVNRDTHEEALKVHVLMKDKGWKRILLVTSAFHMRRAAATFRQLGIDAVPVACDFQSYNGSDDLFAGHDNPIIPRIEGFQHLGLYLHEQGGWLVYRWRGWVAP